MGWASFFCGVVVKETLVCEMGRGGVVGWDCCGASLDRGGVGCDGETLGCGKGWCAVVWRSLGGEIFGWDVCRWVVVCGGVNRGSGEGRGWC